MISIKLRHNDLNKVYKLVKKVVVFPFPLVKKATHYSLRGRFPLIHLLIYMF